MRPRRWRSDVGGRLRALANVIDPAAGRARPQARSAGEPSTPERATSRAFDLSGAPDHWVRMLVDAGLAWEGDRQPETVVDEGLPVVEDAGRSDAGAGAASVGPASALLPPPPVPPLSLSRIQEPIATRPSFRAPAGPHGHASHRGDDAEPWADDGRPSRHDFPERFAPAHRADAVAASVAAESPVEPDSPGASDPPGTADSPGTAKPRSLPPVSAAVRIGFARHPSAFAESPAAAPATAPRTEGSAEGGADPTPSAASQATSTAGGPAVTGAESVTWRASRVELSARPAHPSPADQMRVEPARIEPARVEPARVEPARVEPARTAQRSATPPPSVEGTWPELAADRRVAVRPPAAGAQVQATLARAARLSREQGAT